MADQLTAEQAYLQIILEKFNNDPNSPDLQEVEKILLQKVRMVQQEIMGLRGQIDTLNAEIKERQEKGNGLLQQLMHRQGQSEGYLDSLLAVRK